MGDYVALALPQTDNSVSALTVQCLGSGGSGDEHQCYEHYRHILSKFNRQWSKCPSLFPQNEKPPLGLWRRLQLFTAGIAESLLDFLCVLPWRCPPHRPDTCAAVRHVLREVSLNPLPPTTLFTLLHALHPKLCILCLYRSFRLVDQHIQASSAPEWGVWRQIRLW